MIDATRKRSGYNLIMCSYARKMERTQLSNKIFYNELQKKWKKLSGKPSVKTPVFDYQTIANALAQRKFPFFRTQQAQNNTRYLNLHH